MCLIGADQHAAIVLLAGSGVCEPHLLLGAFPIDGIRLRF
jgi:hypothetical protein